MPENLTSTSSKMISSRRHYHRNRLLRDRIRKEEAIQSALSTKAELEDVDAKFELPDYFCIIPESQDDNRERCQKIVLWDEDS
jgi:hypothetical protein